MSVADILNLEVIAFIAGVGAALIFKCLTGQINLRGVLVHKDGSERVSPERVQLLIATIAAAGSYLSQVSGSSTNVMPDISTSWLYLLSGSSGIYALGKAYATWKMGK